MPKARTPNKVKNRRNNPPASHVVTRIDELSGTTKAQRDGWSRAFWRYLDQNPKVGEIVRRWQRAGCDPRKLAVTIHRYVIYPAKLSQQRKERGKRAKKILKAAVRSLGDLENFYRACDQNEAADRIAAESERANELLSQSRHAFRTKRLGVSRSWTDLAMIEGFVFEATNLRPTAREIVELIRAGRHAAGQTADSWEVNSNNIRKGLKNFKRNNPLQSQLWISPSASDQLF